MMFVMKKASKFATDFTKHVKHTMQTMQVHCTHTVQYVFGFLLRLNGLSWAVISTSLTTVSFIKLQLIYNERSVVTNRICTSNSIQTSLANNAVRASNNEVLRWQFSH